jgi:hypothetical protein
MKVDKEFLLKHHFWILAGLVLLLELPAYILLSTSVAGDNDKEKKTIEAANSQLKAINQVKNSSFLNALKRKDKKLFYQKTEVWEKAWRNQEKIFVFPKLKDNAETNLAKALFGGPLDDTTCAHYESAYGDFIKSQYDKMVQRAPTQFPADDWRGTIRYVKDSDWVRPIDSDDVWLSLEDFWVQYQLLDVIQKTNEVASTFIPVTPPADAKIPKGAVSYQNPYWRLDLWIEKGQLVGFVTNISRRRQTLNATFLVTLHQNGRPVPVPVNHKPKAAGESYPIKQDVSAHNPQGIFGVGMKLDAQSVPVRRIIDLKFAVALANSDRTSNRGLKARKAAEAPASGSEGTAATTTTPTQSTTGGTTSRSGLEKSRYIDVTDQVRRMPVALTVQINEDYMQDLLRQFANSPLRIQTTQMHWQHVEDVRKTKQVNAADNQAQDEEESALVEMSVYGIASLYERPPAEQTQQQQQQ